MDGLKKFLESGVLSDVSFSVGKEQEIFNAHKIILAIKSPVFLAMFEGNVTKSPTTEEETRIQLPDSTPTVFKEFLEYIYLDEEILLNEENWAPILNLADKYDFPHLKKRSVEFVTKACDEENVFDFYSKALRHCVLTHVHFIKFVMGWCQFDSFLTIHNNDILSQIISLDRIMGDEIKIFRAAIHWASSKIYGEEKDGPKLRRILGPALFTIRFPRMPASIFEKEVIPSGIFSEQEIMNIFYKRHHLYQGFAIDFPSHSRITLCSLTGRYIDKINSKYFSVLFQADKKLKIYGYEVFCYSTKGKIILKSGNEILREENIVHQYSSYANFIEFYFDSPVIIEPYTPYTASIEFNSAITMNKYKPFKQTKEVDGVKWRFRDANKEEGSINCILFCRLE